MNHPQHKGPQHTGSTTPTASNASAGSHRSDAGRSSTPSAWPRRTLIIVLSLAGLAIATTLTLFQAGVLDAVWEPFFGDGSRRVLTSSFSQALPVPDAALGAAAYLLEAILESIGGTDRWCRHPWIPAAAGAVAAGLGAAALILIATQALIVEAFCTLCLCSAAISLLVACLAAAETRASIRVLWQRHRARTAHEQDKDVQTAAHSFQHTSIRPVYHTADNPNDPAAKLAAESNQAANNNPDHDDHQPPNPADPSRTTHDHDDKRP